MELFTAIFTIIYVLVARTLAWVFIKQSSHKTTNPKLMLFVQYTIALITYLPIILFYGSSGFEYNLKSSIAFIITGALFGAAMQFRYISMKHVDISISTLIIQLSLIPGIFIPALFGFNKTPLNIIVITGISLVLCGNIAIFYRKNLSSLIKLDKYLIYNITASLFLGLGVISTGYNRDVTDPLTFTLLLVFTAWAYVVLYVRNDLKDLHKEVQIIDLKYIFTGILYGLSGLAVTLAVVNLGFVYGNILLNLTIVTTVLLGIFYLKETKNLKYKILGTLLVVTGSLAVALNETIIYYLN